MYKRYSPHPFTQLTGLFFTGWFIFSLGACATFDSPSQSIQPNLIDHMLVEEQDDIRVSAAILPRQEERTIFGIDLAPKKIQAVWVKVENNTHHPLFLLPTATDQEYFTPAEVAWAYTSKFNKKSVGELAEHLEALRFPVRYPIVPGTAKSGYVFINLTTGTKIIDIDLLYRNFSKTFTLFLVPPDNTEGQRLLAFMDALYGSHELKRISEEPELRQALEQLPCCVTDPEQNLNGEPLNLVMIGDVDAWVTGFIRRGYYYQPLDPRYVFGRAQDMSGVKKIRGYNRPQEHFIRIWKTPIVYRHMPVWVAQASTPLGGRFSKPFKAAASIPIDPHVDETRNDIVQDLAYSQNLKEIGFVKVDTRVHSNDVASAQRGKNVYLTDGLRAVLVFSEGPISLGEIGFLNWETLAPSSAPKP